MKALLCSQEVIPKLRGTLGQIVIEWKMVRRADGWLLVWEPPLSILKTVCSIRFLVDNEFLSNKFSLFSEEDWRGMRIQGDFPVVVPL